MVMGQSGGHARPQSAVRTDRIFKSQSDRRMWRNEDKDQEES